MVDFIYYQGKRVISSFFFTQYFQNHKNSQHIITNNSLKMLIFEPASQMKLGAFSCAKLTDKVNYPQENRKFAAY